MSDRKELCEHENLSFHGAVKKNDYEHDNIFKCDGCGKLRMDKGDKMMTVKLVENTEDLTE